MLPVDRPLEQAEGGEPGTTASLPPAPAAPTPLPDPAPAPEERAVFAATEPLEVGGPPGSTPAPPRLPPPRLRPPPPRDSRVRAPMMTTGRPKSRLPAQMTPTQVRARVDDERHEALAVR